MIKGFKEFILRGNVVDLAVAVVIGAAFSSIVTAFTDKIIKPLLNAITPPTTAGFGPTLVAAKPSTLVDFGALISAAINFVLVAAVVYFAIVLPMRTLQERRKRGMEPDAVDPTDVELLTEIRDLLKAQANVQTTGRVEQPSASTAQLPTSQLAASQPSASQAATSQPSASQLSTSQPPATQPPATQPPATQAPGTRASTSSVAEQAAAPSGPPYAGGEAEPELFTQPRPSQPIESTTDALGPVRTDGPRHAGPGGGTTESRSGPGPRGPVGAGDSRFPSAAPGAPGQQDGANSGWTAESPGSYSRGAEVPGPTSASGTGGARTVGKFSIGSVGERRPDDAPASLFDQAGATGSPVPADGGGPGNRYGPGSQFGRDDQYRPGEEYGPDDEHRSGGRPGSGGNQ